MNPFEYVFFKQVSWAQNQGISPVGKKAPTRPAERFY